MGLPIIFECTGFATNPVFLIKNGRQCHIGGVWDLTGRGNLTFEKFCVDNRNLSEEDIPDEKEIIAAYKTALKENGVSFNKHVVLAG